MSNEAQIGYFFVASACTVVSTILLWRKHRREAEQARLSQNERLQKLRVAIRSQILDSLVTNLLPTRRIYISLSDEERLRRELALIFDNPHVVQALSTLFCALLELQVYPQKLLRARAVQTISSIIGSLALIGALLPLADWLRDEPIEYGYFSLVALLVAAASGVVFAFSAFSRWRSECHLQSILQETWK